MTKPIQQKGPIALKNVASFMAMTTRLIERDPHLPGIGVCHGPSGFGKTWSSIFARNRTRAIVVEVGDSWARKTLLTAILRELGVAKSGSVADLAEAVIMQLGDDVRRPLIIDEADVLLKKGMIELVRELHEKSGAPVILIGEEKLPSRLLGVERLHNRVLDWLPAQPCDFEDARALADAYSKGISISDDLIDAICARSGGRARRIVNNISLVVEDALNRGVRSFDLKDWGGRAFHTGEPPAVRSIAPYARQRAA